MLFVHYILGSTKSGTEIAVAVGVSADPDAALLALNQSSPLSLKLVGVEEGDASRVEEVRTKFRHLRLNGPWFKVAPDLKEHIQSLCFVDPAKAAATKRVSVDLDPEEFHDLEVFVGEMGAKSKADLFRRALRFYRALHRYKAQGFIIQAIKSGKLFQFPDLDDVRGP